MDWLVEEAEPSTGVVQVRLLMPGRVGSGRVKSSHVESDRVAILFIPCLRSTLLLPH